MAIEIDYEALAKASWDQLLIVGIGTAWENLPDFQKGEEIDAVRALIAALTDQRMIVVRREDFAVAVRSYSYTVSRTAHPPEDHHRAERLRATLAPTDPTPDDGGEEDIHE